jgi:hypothetical protein
VGRRRRGAKYIRKSINFLGFGVVILHAVIMFFQIFINLIFGQY